MTTRKWMLPTAFAAVAVLLIGGIAYGLTHSGSGGILGGSNDSSGDSGGGATAPNFAGILDWENTSGKPLTIDGLKGKVVLVDFWTYSCINCQRTFPYLRAWYQKYKDAGLVIVGVHSPEFEFEKNVGNVRAALKTYDIQWPVAVDSNMDTWNAYSNQYWPAEYLIDKKGVIRHTHFGEGEYDVTEQNIQTLLKETGKSMPGGIAANSISPGLTSDSQRETPETYVGSERSDGSVKFTGSWNTKPEYVEHSAATDIGHDFAEINYTARKVFIVASTSGGGQRVYLTLDGKDLAKSDAGSNVKFDDAGHAYVDVDHSDLYSMVTRSDFAQHVLRLSPTTAGFQLYTFTFGS